MKNHLHHKHYLVEKQSLNIVAFMATVHCLSGCAIGEVAGMVIGTALGWSNAETTALAIVLAFLSGYLLTMLPFLRAGYSHKAAMRIALASDTASITIMEIVDNQMMLMIRGAMNVLVIAGIAAFPVNRWLIARGRGHALAHASLR